MTSAPASEHFRRRWFYVLWCSLLGLSLIALAMWETPKQSGTARVMLSLRPLDFPKNCRAQAWVGPHGRWPGAAWTGEGAWAEMPVGEGVLNFPPVDLSVGYRRWVKNFIPRKTSDLLVVKFQAPGVPPRYFVLPMGNDWHQGLLRIGRRMGLQADISWDGLWQDPSVFGEMR